MTHHPVMLKEVLESFEPIQGRTFLDATFGHGGHTEALLDAGAACVYGMDRDSHAFEEYLKDGKQKDNPKLKLIHGPFSEMDQLKETLQFDGVLMDLGVSTRQLLTGERGFSFDYDGPLDMRMDAQDRTLLDRLNKTTEKELRSLFLDIDPKLATRRFIQELIRRRDKGELHSTADLSGMPLGPKGKKNPATTFFLALRVWVNQEKEEIQAGIPKAIELLKPGGRLTLITFHSSEDRWVKDVLKKTPHQTAVYKKPLLPTREEMRFNPRSRSAKLRCVERKDLT